MNPLRRTQAVASIMMMIMLGGCATHQPAKPEVDVAPLSETGQQEVYAKVGVGENGGEFQRFSLSVPGGSNTWVSLGSWEPQWDTQKVTYCQINGQAEACDKKVQETAFTDYSVRPIFYIVQTAFTLGFGALSVPVDYYTDVSELATGIEEATAKTDRGQFDTLNQMLADYYKKADALQSDYQAIRDKDKGGNLIIIDDSGFNSFSTAAIESNLFRFSYLPWSDVIDEDTITANEPTMRALLDTVKRKTSDRHLAAMRQSMNNPKVHCRIRQLFGRFNVTVSPTCPTSLDALPLTVTITSYNFGLVTPDHLSIDNKEIELSLDNGSLTLTNRTNQYLNLDSVSFYYASRIATRNQLNIEIPPHGKQRMGRLKDFDIDGWKITFNDMTKANLESRAVRFDLAAKYQVTGNDRTYTLVDQKSYPLTSLVNIPSASNQ